MGTELDEIPMVGLMEEERRCQQQWRMTEAASTLEDGHSPFCNVTWDSILCWPLIPLNRSIRLPCPGQSDILQEGHAERHCRQRGYAHSNGQVDVVSWSDYSQCFNIELTTHNLVNSEKAFQSIMAANGDMNSHSWTSANAEGGLMESLAAIQRGARQLETIGLIMTIFVICSTIYILHRWRRFHLQENLVRIYVLISLLMLATAKAIVMLDMATSAAAGPLLAAHTRGWCEVWYFLLEFFKACLNFWFFFRCITLFAIIFVAWRKKRALKRCPYLFAGWLAPIFTSITWLSGLIIGDRTTKGATCPELYYHTSEYWSVLLPQLVTLLSAAGFLVAGLVIIFRQFHKTQSEVHVSERPLIDNENQVPSPNPEADAMLSVSTMSSTATILGDLNRHKWQLIVEFIVLLLLALPFALEMFFYAPSAHNLHVVASLNYLASFFSMFQGLFISMLYGFAQISIPATGHRNSVVLQKFEGQKFDA